jgi:hypothetical protein
MPDGDVVYHGVGRGYAGAYHELCEGYFSDEHIAGKIAKALRKSLKRYGNIPITLITQTFAEIASVVASGGIVQPMQESYRIDEAARELMGHRRGAPLSADACKEFAMQVGEGTVNPTTITPVIRGYVRRTLQADFYEHLPLLNHHNDMNPKEIEQRLQDIRPYLDIEIERLVGQIAKTGQVDRLRKEPRNRVQSQPDFSGMDVSMPSYGQNSDNDNA